MKKKPDFQVIPANQIDARIFTIRGHRVMIDRDLAELYDVPVKRLNEQVKRNQERFPGSFMFKLTPDEQKELVAICDRFSNLVHASVTASAFTEHGVLMLANVLKSDRAISVSIHIIEAFVRLKQAVTAQVDLGKKIEEIEARLSGHDEQFKIVQEILLPLLEVNVATRRKIGFNPRED